MHYARVQISSFKDLKVTEDPHIWRTNFEGMNSKKISICGPNFNLQLLADKGIHLHIITSLNRVNFNFDYPSPFNSADTQIAISWLESGFYRSRSGQSGL